MATTREALDILIDLGLYKQGLLLRETITHEYAGDRDGYATRAVWHLTGRFDRDRVKWTQLRSFVVDETAPSLGQLIERMRFLVGDKQPGEDLEKASQS